MASLSKIDRMFLAVEAFKKDPEQSVRAVARIYEVDHTTLYHRLKGRIARHNRPVNSRKLTDLEEAVLVREILDIDSRGFSLHYADVQEMSNRILATRTEKRVGMRWPANLVKRHLELRTRLTRRYDYQRARCEDPAIIDVWFRLVCNTIGKYGIVESDIWNFDETGFMMGIISSSLVVTSSEGRGRAKAVQPGNREWATVIQGVQSTGWAMPPYIVVAGKNHLSSWYRDSPLPGDWVVAVSDNGWTTNEHGLEWIKHFEKHSRPRTTGGYRLLVLDGHESHHSVEFEEYCKENNIITLCMPAHASHLLQPLDVGCFSPLKRAYGREIERLVRLHINHITKVEFLDAFRAAFFNVFGEENVRAGFRGTGLVPYDPDMIISKLDVKLRTPTPTGPPTAAADPWTSQTPKNPYEATSQSNFIKDRIARHQDSSPTSINGAMDQLVKGMSMVMTRMVLMEARICELEEANRTLSKRRREKKTRIRQGGALIVQHARDSMDQQDVSQQLEEETRAAGGRTRSAPTGPRRCGNCGQPGHNVRTCQEDVEMSDLCDSE